MPKVKIKWISTYHNIGDIYTKKYINFNNERINTVKIVDLLDMMINNVYVYNRKNIELNSRRLKSLYGNNYSSIIEYLIKKNVIYLYKNYSSGRRYKIYRFCEDMASCKYLSGKITYPESFITKKEKLNKELNLNNIECEISSHLIDSLYKVKLDIEKTKNIIKNIENENSKYININMIDKISNGDIYHHFDEYGRFHTNFTILKKEIREKCLSINGNDIAELDIKNSQPFFMSIFMKNRGFVDKEYNDDVISGRLYDKLTICSGLERNIVKKEVFRILYGRNKFNNLTPVEKCFKEIYENVYNWIVEYKEKNKNYKILAQELQRTESNFIFNTVIPKILDWKHIPIITVHDSIMFEHIYIDDIRSIWMDCLSKISEI